MAEAVYNLFGDAVEAPVYNMRIAHSQVADLMPLAEACKLLPGTFPFLPFLALLS